MRSREGGYRLLVAAVQADISPAPSTRPRPIAQRAGNYGTTPAHIAATLEVQGRACGICARVPVDPEHNLFIDHDHATGEVSPWREIEIAIHRDRIARLSRAVGRMYGDGRESAEETGA